MEKPGSITKEICEEFGRNTTLHGVRGVCDQSAHVLKRSAWLVLVTGGLGLYAALASISVMGYFNYDSVTKLSTTPVNAIDFPAVTICDQSLYPWSVITSLGPENQQCVLQLLNVGVASNDTFCLGVLNMSFNNIIRAKEQHIHQNLIHCSFNQIEIDCQKYFTTVFQESGMCVTFMSSSLVQEMGRLQQTTAGFLYGLNILFNNRIDDYFYSEQGGEGIRVFIHDPSYYPSIDEESFVLMPGVEAYVAIKKYVKKILSVPYSDLPCQEELQWDYQYEMTKTQGFTNYSFGGCRFDCVMQYISNTCDCVYGSDGENSCSIYTVSTCVDAALVQIYLNQTYNCSCLRLCEEVYYDYKISTLAYPSSYTAAIQYNLTGMTYEELRRSVTSLYVYFPRMDYDAIEQVPSKTATDLVADLGGQLGLFLGASVITICEILECIGQLISQKYSAMTKVGGARDLKIVH